ncbi:MAG TPA: ABC transporter ATP-binding protein [Thermoanaerobaculia bacterium]|nr:ABC transporter ATP-binding protein [Thermoanaerobaculia bacterium]
MTAALEIRELSKTYRSLLGRTRVQALDGVSFEVMPGEVFGLLGPNGAGKTTTVKILLDLTRPSRGEAFILGRNVREPESRLKVGYLPEGHRFPGYLTARETLSIFGRMSGVDSSTLNRRIPVLLERLRIGKWIDIRAKKFSKGMTQRLGLAAALVHDPEVLLLDEPTDGVDPVGRREIRDLLKEEAARGKTIFLNSHLLSEIELTCDRVAVLREGRIAALGRIADLTQREARYRMTASGIDEGLLASFRESGAGIEQSNGHLLLAVKDLEHLNALVDQLRSRGGMLSELAPVRSTLEDVFVDLVKTAEVPISDGRGMD